MPLAGCAGDDEVSEVQTPLPLTFQTSLESGCSVTRAADGDFAADDELLCYVRHVVGEDTVQTRMVTILNREPTEPLYWDDFSESTDDGSKDLRTTGHGLQSYYGYCYNGGTPTAALVEATGVLGWTTAADQSADGAMKANDLIWSSEQSAITYQHARDLHGTLTVPYTHAMSKFTLVVVAGDGFGSDDLDAATVTLKDMNLTGTFTAPAATVVASGSTDVLMYANPVSVTTEGNSCRAYEAVAVPMLDMSAGNLLATVNNADGNDYEVNLTDAILTAWADGIQDDKSRSGVNYKLTITLNKQVVSVVATLANWTDVSATGTGEILFAADVETIDKSNDGSLSSGDSFSLWMSTDNTSFGEIATTATYDGSRFVNSPAVYWADGSTSYYFRALAQQTGTHTLEAITTTAASLGTDLLWGTTAAHIGTEADGTEHTYAEGAAINPRTGEVPLVFRHAMSNVVVNLTTTDDASAVELTGASVTMSNLYTDGSIDIATGVVTNGSTQSAVAVSGETIMVPQTIGDDVKLVITLADGTTYSLQLNTCTDTGGAAITSWAGGNRYTYTISLQKEAILFRVLVQDWVQKTGSGNATLDWD